MMYLSISCSPLAVQLLTIVGVDGKESTVIDAASGVEGDGNVMRG